MNSPFPAPGSTPLPSPTAAALPSPPDWARTQWAAPDPAAATDWRVPTAPPAPPQWVVPREVLRAGQLTSVWRTVMIAGWIGFLTSFGAILQAGRDAGISPWWAGSESSPRSPLLLVAPFALGLITLLLAVRNNRFACWFGVLAALAALGIGLRDLDPYQGLGQAQLVVAVAALCITLAALSGRLRKQLDN